MNDLILAYTITLSFASVIASLFVVYRYFLGNKLLQQANKLKSQMANIRREFPDLERNRSEIVGSAIGDIGINGIISELGIDPSILKNPLVQGLIKKYAPRLIEQLAKQGEGKDGSQSQSEEINLL